MRDATAVCRDSGAGDDDDDDDDDDDVDDDDDDDDGKRENCHSQKVFDIFPFWQFVQENCHMNLLLLAPLAVLL